MSCLYAIICNWNSLLSLSLYLSIYIYISFLLIFLYFHKLGEQFVSFLVTKVLYGVWQHPQMDAFLYHVELIARKPQFSRFSFFFFFCYEGIKVVTSVNTHLSIIFTSSWKWTVVSVSGYGMYLLLPSVTQMTPLIILWRFGFSYY